MSTRVYIVDDHQIVRDGLKLILREDPQIQVVGEAPNGQAALEQILHLKPDLVTTDVEMPGVDGISLTRQLRAKAPHIRVLMLTAHAESPMIREALQAGVTGYLLKLNAGQDFLHAIRTVMNGQVYLSPEISTVVVRDYQRHIPVPNHTLQGVLSEREREILKGIADGQTTKEIALGLSLSSKTIESHRLNIMAKLKMNSIADLTKYAIREGLTQL